MLHETQKVPKTTAPANLYVLNQIDILLQKPNQMIPALDHYGNQKLKNSDKNNTFT